MVLDPRFSEAASAFRRFFVELREAFLERDSLLTQLELALLCREHVLVLGPPGTAKSAIAGATLGRLIDEKTGMPSLFSKQLAENTVQTDLIGPVDFKVLTETGRTEHLTDEGMLGATHAFLDEVFDGRDMLLRSILNVLHERELKHGRQVTKGLCECAVMTSNRYLSEVLQRSPETLQAFADRISFICFTPKSFAQRSSRSQMLWRAQSGQRPALHERLTLQQLDALQAAVEQVEVPAIVHEGLEALSDAVEKELLSQVARLPDYVPTKYFSQRSLVKALWALKAVVVRELIYRRPDRKLVAELGDLEMLRHFFLLGGPPPKDVELLLKDASDPRERAQLEIIRVEHRSFDEALRRVLPTLAQAAQREATELITKDESASAEGLLKHWTPAVASTLAVSLRSRLVPGPRHPETRAALVRLAEVVTNALETKLSRSAPVIGEGRGGAALVASLRESLELVRRVPELEPRLGRVVRATIDYSSQALELIALAAEGAAFDDALKVDGLAGLASELGQELGGILELLEVAALANPDANVVRDEKVAPVRRRVALALRQHADRAYLRGGTGPAQSGDLLDQLSAEARKLKHLEDALVAFSADQRGLRGVLLGPIGEAWAREVVAAAPASRLGNLAHTLQSIVDNLHREGASPQAALASVRGPVEVRIREIVRAATAAPRPPPPTPKQAVSGDAHAQYLQLAQTGLDGELRSLRHLDELLRHDEPASVIDPSLQPAVASAELASLRQRIGYLSAWLAAVVEALPKASTLQGHADAERTFDALVKSRFPLLVTREGELLRLGAAVDQLGAEPGAHGEEARALSQAVRRVAEQFQRYSRQVLDARAAR